MTITRANIDACQEALYLLRQDVPLPAVEDADADANGRPPAKTVRRATDHEFEID